MRTKFKLLRLLGFLAGFFILNMLCTLMCVPYHQYNYWNQNELNDPENHYTVVAIGSSEVQRAFCPETAEAILGGKAFNGGSSAAKLSRGVYAVFLNTLENQKDLTDVVLMIGLSDCNITAEGTPYYNGLAPYLESGEAVREYMKRSFSDGDWLMKLFPWSGNIPSLSNLRIRLSSDYRNHGDLYRPAELTPSGQLLCNEVYSFDSNKALLKNKQNAFRDEETDDDSITPEALETLRKMTEKCNASGIHLTVVISPVSVNRIWMEKAYFSFSDTIRRECTEYGASFIDLNLAKKEYWDNRQEYYKDISHMNTEGARSATEAISGFILRERNGEDISDCFYSSSAEFVDSIDHIEAVTLAERKGPNGARFTACAVTGHPENAEYRFVLLRNGEEDTVLSEFGNANEIWSRDFEYESGDVLRVTARYAGAPEEDDLHYYDIVLK